MRFRRWASLVLIVCLVPCLPQIEEPYTLPLASSPRLMDIPIPKNKRHAKSQGAELKFKKREEIP